MSYLLVCFAVVLVGYVVYLAVREPPKDKSDF